MALLADNLSDSEECPLTRELIIFEKIHKGVMKIISTWIAAVYVILLWRSILLLELKVQIIF